MIQFTTFQFSSILFLYLHMCMALLNIYSIFFVELFMILMPFARIFNTLLKSDGENEPSTAVNSIQSLSRISSRSHCTESLLQKYAAQTQPSAHSPLLQNAPLNQVRLCQTAKHLTPLHFEQGTCLKWIIQFCRLTGSTIAQANSFLASCYIWAINYSKFWINCS